MTAALALKADQSTTYTKTEVDNALAPKATTAYVDAQLALKANQNTTYAIAQVGTALGLKAQHTGYQSYTQH